MLIPCVVSRVFFRARGGIGEREEVGGGQGFLATEPSPRLALYPNGNSVYGYYPVFLRHVGGGYGVSTRVGELRITRNGAL